MPPTPRCVRDGGRRRPAEVATLLLTMAAIAACGDGLRTGAVEETLRRLDGVAARGVWPGFDPRDVPLVLYDGSRTWLVRHPSAPEGFEPVGEGMWRMDGRHPVATGNMSADLGGVRVAVAAPDSSALADPAALAGLLAHEAFHVHQDRRHPEWIPNEVERFTYPVTDARALQLRRLETAALRRSLGAPDSARTACWASTAARLRRDRAALLPAGAEAYERGAELREGLARYVEARAIGRSAPPELPPQGYPPEAVRTRAYEVGHAFAWLLDRHRPAWKEELAAGDTTSLPDLLGSVPAVAEASRRGCGFPRDEFARALEVARADIRRLEESNAAARRRFESRPGWAIEVTAAGPPLAPTAFDPQNVRILDGATVLHTRWLRLEREGARLEVLGTEALTEAAGAHPLFEGVRRLLVTGLREAPRVERGGDTLRVAAAGFEAAFPAGMPEVDEAGRTLRIRLGAAEE